MTTHLMALQVASGAVKGKKPDADCKDLSAADVAFLNEAPVRPGSSNKKYMRNMITRAIALIVKART